MLREHHWVLLTALGEGARRSTKGSQGLWGEGLESRSQDDRKSPASQPGGQGHANTQNALAAGTWPWSSTTEPGGPP